MIFWRYQLQVRSDSGGVVKWLTCWTSNLRITSCMGTKLTQAGASRCFLEQDMVSGTGLESVSIASYTFILK